MRVPRTLLIVSAFIVALLATAPVEAQTYFPFGSVNIGISSSGVRVGPFGCYVNTSDPTYTNGQIHPCSLTVDGRIRVDIKGIFAEDSAHVSGDSLSAIGCVRNDTPGSLAGTTGDYAPCQTNSSGAIYGYSDNDNAYDNPADAVKVLLVDATGTVLEGGADFTQDTALTVATVSGPMEIGRASAAAPTDVSASNDAVMAWRNLAGAGASFLVGTSNAIIAGDASGLETQGGVSHDAADAGNPSSMGATAETAISAITAVADGDRTKLYAGIDGVLIMRQHANLEDRVSAVAAVTDGASTSLVAAQGAGLRFCATTLVISNSSATNVTVDLRDGTAGSVLMTVPAAANMGGAVIPLTVPLCTTANTILAVDPSAAASTVTTTAIGFKTKL